MLPKGASEFLHNIWIAASLFPRQTGLSQLGLDLFQPDSSWNDHGNSVHPGRIGVDADVLHTLVKFQQGLHLAQADILPTLELHQVLLPVNYPDCAIRHHLSNVPRFEPALVNIVEKLLLSFLRKVVVLLGNVGPANHDFPSWTFAVGHSVTPFLPTHKS